MDLVVLETCKLKLLILPSRRLVVTGEGRSCFCKFKNIKPFWNL